MRGIKVNNIKHYLYNVIRSEIIIMGFHTGKHGKVYNDDKPEHGNSNDSPGHSDGSNESHREELNDEEQITMKEFNDSGNYFEDEVRRRSDAKGGHFFDKDSMRFFSSRISELMWQVGNVSDYKTNDIYFITSEQDRGGYEHSGSVRAYTIRKADADGDIDTVSEFQEFATLGEARKELRNIIGKVAK